MIVVSFLQDSWKRGKATVASRMQPFAEEDLRESVALLRQNYEEDALEMSDATLWGAYYSYCTAQFDVLRDLDEEGIKAQIQEFAEPITPKPFTRLILPSLTYLTYFL